MGELRPGEVVDGRYEVVRPLGEGAMCRVVLAEHLELRRQVALKIPRERLLATPTGLARFLREARAAARLVHPNVVEIYEVGESPEAPFLALEYVSGGDLRAAFDAGCPLERSLSVLAGVARALGAAGAAGVVHRDLKPENVMVTSEGRAKVADWGLSKLLDASTKLTATGAAVGTPFYMSPEQLGRGDVGPAADWYALGLVLYEAVLVAAGWERRAILTHMSAHMQGRLPSLAATVEGVPEDLARLAGALLERDPARRPRDPEAVAGVIEGAVSVSRVVRTGGPKPRRLRVAAAPAEAPGTGPRSASLLRTTSSALLVLVLVALLGLAFLRRGATTGPATPAGGAALRVRELSLVSPVLAQMRFEGGVGVDAVTLRVRRSGGGAGPVVTVPLSRAQEVSQQVRVLDVALPEAVVDDVEVEVVDAAGGPPAVLPLSGRAALDALLAPIRRLTTERLGSLLCAVEAMRKAAKGPGGGPERWPGTRSALLALLDADGLDESVRSSLRSALPLLLADGGGAGSLARDLMPLRMIEAQVAGIPGGAAPWPSIAGLLGQRQDEDWPKRPQAGWRILAEADLRLRVRRPSKPSKSMLIARWLLDEAELERTRQLRRVMVDSSIGDDSISMAWETAASEALLDVPMAAGVTVDPRGKLVMALRIGYLWREAYLEVELNGRGGATLMNVSPLDPDTVSYQTWSFPVEPSWLVPGVNRLRVRARCMPGIRPLAGAGLMHARILAQER